MAHWYVSLDQEPELPLALLLSRGWILWVVNGDWNFCLCWVSPSPDFGRGSWIFLSCLFFLCLCLLVLPGCNLLLSLSQVHGRFKKTLKTQHIVVSQVWGFLPVSLLFPNFQSSFIIVCWIVSRVLSCIYRNGIGKGECAAPSSRTNYFLNVSDIVLLPVEMGSFHRVVKKAFQGPTNRGIRLSGKIYWGWMEGCPQVPSVSSLSVPLWKKPCLHQA